MRFASYLNLAGVPTWGAEQGGMLHDLGPSGLGVASTLKAAIVDARLADLPDLGTAPTQPTDGTTFLPVIGDPGKIICIGVNYRTHQSETGRADVPAPTVFIRYPDTLAAHGADLPIPSETAMYDYEGELALVVGAPASHVSEADAWDVVAGYTAFNDLSARDWQRHTGQWTPGKNFPASGPFGPFYTPAGDLGDITDLVLETRVNGEVRQHARLSDLIFDIPAIIAYVTTFTPLAAGDVIVTGTPGGVGLFRTPPQFLSAGDVVEVEISKLGTLRNRLVS